MNKQRPIRKSDCCNAEIEGVVEYAREEPWGVVGGHYECSRCGKETLADGRNVDKLQEEETEQGRL